MTRQPDRYENVDRVFSETALTYIPIDYGGEIGRCWSCGNAAPATPRVKGLIMCSPCWVGSVVNDTASESEAQAIIDELIRERITP